MSLTFVDLFAGVGGFHLALQGEPINARFVWGAEIDEECRATYRVAFKQDLHEDIRSVTQQWETENGSTSAANTSQIQATVPRHDILCAGFPCQPFSKSGHQRGIEETRGTLFFDILAILSVHRPRFILLENVMNLIGPRHRDTWRTIIYQLRSIGYAVSDSPTVLSPHRLPANAGGAPQHRERVFIPGIYVGSNANRLTALGPLVPRVPFAELPTWDFRDWIDDTMPAELPPPVRPDQLRAVDVWNDLLPHLGRIPGIPIWGAVLRGELAQNDDHPSWKNDTIAANERFKEANLEHVRDWLRRHDNLDTLHPSYRKLEWQAGDSTRDIWCHAIQFRPSGIRVKPLSYLPALVAISQTSILGPLRRRITTREAATIQGFPSDFPFQSRQAHIYHQLGNAVSVGVTRYIAASLILGTAGTEGGYGAPLEWIEARNIADQEAAA